MDSTALFLPCIYILFLPHLTAGGSVLTGWNTVDLGMTNTGNVLAGYDFVTNKAYLLGGNSGGCAISSCDNDLYSWDLDALSTSGSQSTISETVRSYSQAYVTIDRMIYFVIDGTIKTYDMSSGAYNSNFASLSGIGSWPCMATDGRYLFVTGGQIGGLLGSIEKTFQIYDLQTNQVISAPNMNDGRSEHSCVAASNGYLYAIAGRSDTNDLLTHYRTGIERIYIGDMTNIASQSWTGLSSSLSERKARLMCNEMSQRIYVIGGQTRGTVNLYSSVEVIDLTNNDAISSGPSLSESRSAAGIIAGSDNRIYVLNGEGGTLGAYRGTAEYSNVIDPPTMNPTSAPTKNPTANPSASPTPDPTSSPTTAAPTTEPTGEPTVEPTTAAPTTDTLTPTALPTASPTKVPTENPTTVSPTAQTEGPTQSPIAYESAEVEPTTTKCEDGDCQLTITTNVYLGMNETLFYLVVASISFVFIVLLVFVIWFCLRKQKNMKEQIESLEKAKSISDGDRQDTNIADIVVAVDADDNQATTDLVAGEAVSASPDSDPNMTMPMEVQPHYTDGNQSNAESVVNAPPMQTGDDAEEEPEMDDMYGGGRDVDHIVTPSPNGATVLSDEDDDDDSLDKMGNALYLPGPGVSSPK